MKIIYQRDGGLAFFPGLQRPCEINDELLDVDQQHELSRLVDACRFFTLPRQVGGAASGAADYIVETLRIERAGQQHQVRVVSPPDDAALGLLLRTVRALADQRR